MSKTVPENCPKLAIHETRAFMASVCRDSWNNPALFSHRQNQFSQTHTMYEKMEKSMKYHNMLPKLIRQTGRMNVCKNQFGFNA